MRALMFSGPTCLESDDATRIVGATLRRCDTEQCSRAPTCLTELNFGLKHIRAQGGRFIPSEIICQPSGRA